MADRCSGDCCRLFFQARSPINWAHKKRRAEIILRKYAGRLTADEVRGWREEIYVADMLVFKFALTHSFSWWGRWMHPTKGERWHYYSCRHFDGKNCMAYESRPRMCSDYPHYGHGGACQYPRCTWHHGKYPHAKDVRGTRMTAEMEEDNVTVAY